MDCRCFFFPSLCSGIPVLEGMLVSLVLPVSEVWSLRDCVSLLTYTSWSGWKALLALFPVVNCGYIQTECKRLFVLRSVRGRGAIASFLLILLSPSGIWRKDFYRSCLKSILLPVMWGKNRDLRKGPWGIYNSFGFKKLLVSWTSSLWEITYIFGFLSCQLASILDRYTRRLFASSRSSEAQ